MRVTEKHLRDEVTNRCIEFLDIAINFILYVEQIYANDMFEKRSKYNLIVYECQDGDVQHYIFEFLNGLKNLLRKQLIDQIGFVIWRSDENVMLRRYLFEFHQIVDHSSNVNQKDSTPFLAELDLIFSNCLKELILQTPVFPAKLPDENGFDDEIHWKLQIRLCRHGSQRVDIDETFYEQLKLTEQFALPMKKIKSFHSQRLNLQYFCQEKD